MMLSSLLQVTLVMSWATYVVSTKFNYAPNTVAFSAYASGPDNVPRGDNFLFNEVTVNAGNAFDSGSGFFKAPVKGIYAFHTTLYTQAIDNWAYANIMSEGKILCTLEVHDTDSRSQRTAHTAVELDKDQQVSVRAWQISPHMSRILGSPTSRLVMFGGFLIAKAR